MSQFTTRVELHGATQGDYDKLHQAMEAKGFKRTVSGVDSNGKPATWHLPTAEYDFNSTMACAGVRDLAKATADNIKYGAWVLVTEVANRSWNTATTAAKAA